MDPQIAEIQREIAELKQRLSDARRAAKPEQVLDHQLTDWSGNKVPLSSLFGAKDDLLVIHNMGASCAYCTLWADGFSTLLPHLADRAGFIVVSPDSPEVQREFAGSRGWQFQMLSAEGSTFIEDLGYKTNEGYWPGVSALHRNTDGSIERTNHDFFGPGDDYSPPWAFFDLLRNGVNGWEPRFAYR